ncbi:MAG TPA: cohesin domain-containing protein [bacterium]|nr:cohesin domain-containing protein [bacterium]HOL35083.1 cohesin domain-containing protein [bacterium]HPP07864.1 cohesin domain-containing protein [bacterium]
MLKKYIGLTIAVLAASFCMAFSATVTIPQNLSGLVDGTVDIPVNIDNATGVAGFQFKITFNKDILKATGTGQGSLTGNWLIAANVQQEGTISVAGYDPNLIGLQQGSGSLCVLRFKVVATGQTSLNFQQGKLVDSNGKEIKGVSYTNGSFTGQTPPQYASITGQVVYEGMKTGKIYVVMFSTPDISGEPVKVVEIGTKGGTYSYQILDIAAGQYYIYAWMDADNNGKYDLFNDPAGAYSGNPITIAAGDEKTGINITVSDPVGRKIYIPSDAQAAAGQEVIIPINIDNALEVGYFESKVWNWDNNILEFQRCEKGNLLFDDWGFTYETLNTGGVRIIGIGTKSFLPFESGSLANIIFKVRGTASVGSSTNIEFDTNNSFIKEDISSTEVIPADFTNGKFTVVSAPSFTVQLKAGGWNLISFPVEPSITSPKELIPNLVSIWEWNGSYVETTALQAKKGYWILVSQDTEITVTGTTPSDTTVHLIPGWNLVGPIEDTTRPVNENIISVYGWGAPPAGGYSPVEVGGSCNRGKGYWFLATQATDIWSAP